MNRRSSPRVYLLPETIEVMVTQRDGSKRTGIIRDLSEAGICFYTYDELTSDVTVSFVWNDMPVELEVELLRNVETSFGCQHSGRFKGAGSRISLPRVPAKEEAYALAFS